LGGDCTVRGTTIESLQPAAGFWRANSQIPQFYRCRFPSHCVGGTDTATGAAACETHRTGPLCGVCEEGFYGTPGGSCIRCPDTSSSSAVGYFIGIAIVIIVALWLQFYIVARSGSTLLLSIVEKEDQETQDVDHFADTDKHEDIKYEDSTIKPDAGEQPVEDDNVDIYTQQYMNPKNTHMMTIYGPPIPPSNFTYKLKIFITFLQIVTNLGSGLEIVWPSTFKEFVLWFDIANFDFMLTQASSAECISTFNYYGRYLVIVCFPFAVWAGLTVLYLLPRYLRIWRYKNYNNTAVARAVVTYWKMSLYLLFLVWPGVCAIILRHYICKSFNTGQSYIFTNLDIECNTSRWNSYAYAGAFLIAVYPIGVPLFFFFLLWYNLSTLHLDRTKAAIGFLYAGYRIEAWWFEMVDMAHKLFLTCLIAFIPGDYQLPVGMVVAIIYMVILLRLHPYIRPEDDTLQLLAQTEIYLLLLAGSIFYHNPIEQLGNEEDKFLSAVLIILTLAIILSFLIFGALLVRRMYLEWKAEKEKQNQEEQRLNQRVAFINQQVHKQHDAGNVDATHPDNQV